MLSLKAPMANVPPVAPIVTVAPLSSRSLAPSANVPPLTLTTSASAVPFRVVVPDVWLIVPSPRLAFNVPPAQAIGRRRQLARPAHRPAVQGQGGDAVVEAAHAQRAARAHRHRRAIVEPVAHPQRQRAAVDIDRQRIHRPVQGGRARCLVDRPQPEVGIHRATGQAIGRRRQLAAAAHRPAAQGQCPDGVVEAAHPQRACRPHRHHRAVGQSVVRAQCQRAAVDVDRQRIRRAVQGGRARCLVDRAQPQIGSHRAARQGVGRRCELAGPADGAAVQGQAADGVVEVGDVQRACRGDGQHAVAQGAGVGGLEAAVVDRRRSGVAVAATQGEDTGCPAWSVRHFR